MRGRGRGGRNNFNNHRQGNDGANEDRNHNGRGRFRGRGRGNFRGNRRNSFDSADQRESTTYEKKLCKSGGTNILKSYDELMKSVLNETKINCLETEIKEDKLLEEKSEGEVDSSSDEDSNAGKNSSSREIELETETPIANEQLREINYFNDNICQEKKNNFESKTYSPATKENERDQQKIEPLLVSNKINQTKTITNFVEEIGKIVRN